MANPILEANENAWRDYDLSRDDEPSREDFDNGWDAALDATRPIIEAAVATWRMIAAGSGGLTVEGLGGAGVNALAAAEQWLEAVK